MSLFIDNTVILKTDPEAFLNENMDASGFSLPHHSYRSTVLDEFITVLDSQLDDPNRIFEQFDEYSSNCPSILREKPYWTGILLRDHRNPTVRAVSEIWFAHVLRYSRRDQLSLNLAFRQAGLSPKTLLIDNKESCFHSWPHAQARKHKTRSWNNAHSPAPSAVRIRELGRSQKVAEEALAVETWHRVQLLARHVEARGQIKKARARIKVLEGALASARAESAAAAIDIRPSLRPACGRRPRHFGCSGVGVCVWLVSEFSTGILPFIQHEPAPKLAFWTWKPDVGCGRLPTLRAALERGQGADEMAQRILRSEIHIDPEDDRGANSCAITHVRSGRHCVTLVSRHMHLANSCQALMPGRQLNSWPLIVTMSGAASLSQSGSPKPLRCCGKPACLLEGFPHRQYAFQNAACMVLPWPDSL